jgi:hypothetical protein
MSQSLLPHQSSSKLDHLSPNTDPVALFHPDGTNKDHGFRLFFYIVVYPKTADAKLPGRQRIGAHGLTVSRFSRRLVCELPFHDIEDYGLLSSAEYTQMLFGIGRVLDSKWQELMAR